MRDGMYLVTRMTGKGNRVLPTTLDRNEFIEYFSGGTITKIVGTTCEKILQELDTRRRGSFEAIEER
jgi:hypothetical protein